MICRKSFLRGASGTNKFISISIPNEREALQQAWWLSENLVQDISEAANYKGCRWYFPLPKGKCGGQNWPQLGKGVDRACRAGGERLQAGF